MVVYTPPMGFNTWNTFGDKINEQMIKEIADALDMPINTVKTKIRRAKAQLLKMMDYSDELL